LRVSIVHTVVSLSEENCPGCCEGNGHEREEIKSLPIYLFALAQPPTLCFTFKMSTKMVDAIFF